MNILDYFFYRVYIFYSKKRDRTPLLMGCLVLSALFAFNLLSLILMLSLAKRQPVYIPKWLIALVGATLPIILYYRYRDNNRLNQLKKTYIEYSDEQNKYRGIIIIIYVIVSLSIPPIYGFLKHNLGI